MEVQVVSLVKEVLGREESERLRALEILYNTSRSFVECADVVPLLRELLNATMALLHAEKGFVELVDRREAGLRVVAQRGYPEAVARQLRLLRIGGGPEGEHPQPRSIIEDASCDPGLEDARRALFAEAGVRGLQSTPVYSGDAELVAVVSTQYTNPRRPREADLGFLDSVIEDAGRFLARLQREQNLRESVRIKDELLSALRSDVRAPLAGGGARRKVLVVDDNEDAANMLGELLEDAGHHIRTAYTGADALREAEVFCPNVILLDIGLPDMDGYEVARQLRSGPAGSAVIAALTGWAQASDIVRSEAAGINVHLIKPASLQAIEEVIDRAEPRDPGQPLPGAGPSSAPGGNKTAGTARRVLVVDDDTDIRESLMEFLDEHGFDVLGARDGHDALEKLSKADPMPCLIILDLMMPNMDGRAFREKQLERASLAGIPVVVISAYRDVEQNARDLHVSGWLPKPLNLPALLRVVREACADA